MRVRTTQDIGKIKAGSVVEVIDLGDEWHVYDTEPDCECGHTKSAILKKQPNEKRKSHEFQIIRTKRHYVD